MGINASKLTQKASENINSEEQAQEVREDTNAEQGSIPSTPILTPKIHKENIKKENLDPRSPSKHIARTPIEVLSATAEKLQSLTLENNDNNVSKETPLKTHLILGIDPRSPSFEIQRTPIVVSASPDKKLPDTLRNKNLDKVRKCELPDTPKNKIIPPKLLESCPVTPVNPKPKLDTYKRKSMVLLETNIDYTETDLDSVIKEKYLGNSLENLSAQGETPYKEISDPRSPSVDFLRTPIQVSKKLQDLGLPTIQIKPLQNEDTGIEELNKTQNEENSVNIEELSHDNVQTRGTDLPDNKEGCIVGNWTIVQETEQNLKKSEGQDCKDDETEQSQVPTNILATEPLIDISKIDPEEPFAAILCNKVLPTSTKQEIVLSPEAKHECQLTKSAPVSPPHIICVTPKESKSQPVTPPLIDLTANVQELDKKLTHLIYEDKDLVVCPRIVKIKDQNRTPLGLRNGNENKNVIENKKVSQKLKVSDKPRKAEYAVSKIPVFKDKKIKIQCENTPPKNMRGNNRKKSQWDPKDDTLVI